MNGSVRSDLSSWKLLAGYGRGPGPSEIMEQQISLDEFYSSLHQQLCHQGPDGANGFINAKSDPRRQNIRKRWVQAQARTFRTAEREAARTHRAAKALRALAWGYWNPSAGKSAYVPEVPRLNL